MKISVKDTLATRLAPSVGIHAQSTAWLKKELRCTMLGLGFMTLQQNAVVTLQIETLPKQERGVATISTLGILYKNFPGT